MTSGEGADQRRTEAALNNNDRSNNNSNLVGRGEAWSHQLSHAQRVEAERRLVIPQPLPPLAALALLPPPSPLEPIHNYRGRGSQSVSVSGQHGSDSSYGLASPTGSRRANKLANSHRANTPATSRGSQQANKRATTQQASEPATSKGKRQKAIEAQGDITSRASDEGNAPATREEEKMSCVCGYVVAKALGFRFCPQCGGKMS